MTLVFTLIFTFAHYAVPLTTTYDTQLQRHLTNETNLSGAYEITAQEYKEL